MPLALQEYCLAIAKKTYDQENNDMTQMQTQYFYDHMNHTYNIDRLEVVGHQYITLE